MKDYLLLMHADDRPAPGTDLDKAWEHYLTRLRLSGNFSGGSAIGGGACFAKSGATKAITPHLSGYMRVQADSLEAAQQMLTGNPVYEAGGTVEIRELPRD